MSVFSLPCSKDYLKIVRVSLAERLQNPDMRYSGMTKQKTI